MPAPLNVDREAVKTLVLSIGVREAARQMHIPENTVLAWSRRFDWLADTKPQPAKLSPPASQVLQSPAALNAIAPSQALQNHLNGAKLKSRSLLAKFVVNAAQVASRSRTPLRDAEKVKHVAAVHSAIWPEEKGAGGVVLNFGVQVGGME